MRNYLYERKNIKETTVNNVTIVHTYPFEEKTTRGRIEGTKRAILRRKYFTRKLFFPQQVLHPSREQLTTFPPILPSFYFLTSLSLFIQFSRFSSRHRVYSVRPDIFVEPTYENTSSYGPKKAVSGRNVAKVRI